LPLQYIRREIDNSLQKTEQKKKQKGEKHTLTQSNIHCNFHIYKLQYFYDLCKHGQSLHTCIRVTIECVDFELREDTQGSPTLVASLRQCTSRGIPTAIDGHLTLTRWVSPDTTRKSMAQSRPDLASIVSVPGTHHLDP
jgi:hypothetical protein